MDDLQIIPASASQQELLRNLVNLYLYDFSAYTGEDANEKGRFEYGYLPYYWTEPERSPFLILVDGKPAGFVLVRDTREGDGGQIIHHMAEFFVMRKYRRNKVGQRAAWAIFDRFPGRWFVSEIEENQPAQAFWRKVIGEYTAGKFEDTRVEEWEGPVQFFVSPGKEKR